MPALAELTGQQFGRLTVIERKGTASNGSATWLCKCECGSTCVVVAGSIMRGLTKSCGCLHKETAGSNLKSHGKSRTRLHVVWKSMKNRCYNPNSNMYKRYGARGIGICDEWLHDFQAFFDWAMANGYDENARRGQCTIDRIDYDEGYSPDNCRWVDMKVQNNNKPSNRQKGKEDPHV